MTMGERIRALIEQREIMQKDLANAINVSSSSLSNYITGCRSPDYGTLCAIADYFSVSCDYLLGRSAADDELVISGLTEREKKIVSALAQSLLENRL